MLKKNQLPSIPGAQLTGMVKYIQRYPMAGETISTEYDMSSMEEGNEFLLESSAHTSTIQSESSWEAFGAEFQSV